MGNSAAAKPAPYLSLCKRASQNHHAPLTPPVFPGEGHNLRCRRPSAHRTSFSQPPCWGASRRGSAGVGFDPSPSPPPLEHLPRSPPSRGASRRGCPAQLRGRVASKRSSTRETAARRGGGLLLLLYQVPNCGLKPLELRRAFVQCYEYQGEIRSNAPYIIRHFALAGFRIGFNTFHQ